jgi:hypothetical protein
MCQGLLVPDIAFEGEQIGAGWGFGVEELFAVLSKSRK